MSKYFAYLPLLVIILLVLFINVFPNYYAFVKTPEGSSFTGQASWFDPWDINVYEGAIRWGQSQGILLENIFTTIPNKAILYYPLYTLVGSIFPNVSVPLLFNLFSLIFGAVLIVVLFKLSGIFLKSLKDRYLAVILISLAGGLGWITYPQIQSADLAMTGFTFLSSFQRPHEAMGVILYLLSLCLFYYFTVNEINFLLRNKKIIWEILALLSGLLLIFFYPFYTVSILLISGIFSYYLYLKTGEKRNINISLLNALLLIPSSLYYFFYLQQNPTFAGVLGQILTTPNLLNILSGYGILLILFIYQLFKTKKDASFWFLVIWLVVSWLLSFLPLGFARFYLRTLFFPLVILAVRNLPSKKFLWLILLIIVPISAFYITYKRVAEAGGSNRWIYISKEEQNGINFLNSQKGDGVLASYTLGNLIPVYTNKKVYFGHLLQTPGSPEKLQFLGKFYSNQMSEAEAKNFLVENNIFYIFYGVDEQNLTRNYSGNNKLNYSFLKPIFSEGIAQIFIY